MASVEPPDGRGGGPALGESFAKSFPVVAKGGHQGFFKPIQLASRQFGSKEGCPSIHFSPSELQEGSHRLQHSLIAKFSNGIPHIDIVRKTFTKSWNLLGEASIGAWYARHVLIFLKSNMMRGECSPALAGKFRTRGFAFCRWSPDFHTKKEPTLATAWVKLLALPPHMYDIDIIKLIVSSFGQFIGVDERTKQFNDPSYARCVYVEMDLNNPIPEKVWISLGSTDSFWLQLEFQSKLLYCSNCMLHGHQLSACRKTKPKSIKPIPAKIKIPKVNLSPKAPDTFCGSEAGVQKESIMEKEPTHSGIQKLSDTKERWRIQKKKEAKKRPTKVTSIRGETSFKYVEKSRPTAVLGLQVSIVKPYVLQISNVEPPQPGQEGTCISSLKIIQNLSQTEPTLNPFGKSDDSLDKNTSTIVNSVNSENLPLRVWSLSNRQSLVYVRSRAKAKASPDSPKSRSLVMQHVSPFSQ